MRPLALILCASLISLPAVAASPQLGHGPRLHNTGLASTSALRGAGDLLPFITRERSQGDTDLDGNGDTNGFIFFIYDGQRNRVINTMLDSRDGGFRLADPGVVFLSVVEWSLGQDVNQDGDVWDPVLHVYDQRTDRILNTEWIGHGGYNWHRKVILPGNSPLENAGVFDLDTGNRETLGVALAWVEVVRDEVLVGVLGDPQLGLLGAPHSYEPDTGALIPLRIEGRCDAPFDAGDVAVFLCQEYSEIDLNGDGDSHDRVPVVYDPGTGAVTALDFSAAPLGSRWGLLASDGWAVVVASEARSGATDLNADGDLEDDILFSVRLGTGSIEITNTEEALGDYIRQEGPLAVFQRQETDDDPGYLSGFDAERGEMFDLGERVSFSSVVVTSDIIVFEIREYDYKDLNRDGDTLDSVVHYYDRRRGTIFNTGLGRNGSLWARPAGEWLAVETRDCRPASLAGAGYECVTLIDSRSQRRIVHRLPGLGVYLSENIFAVQSPEHKGAFEKDLNGDGDTSDHVLFLMELPARGP